MAAAKYEISNILGITSWRIMIFFFPNYIFIFSRSSNQITTLLGIADHYYVKIFKKSVKIQLKV